MAEITFEHLKVRTYTQGKVKKTGVEFYSTLDPPELKAAQDLIPAQAEQLRDFLIAEYPVE